MSDAYLDHLLDEAVPPVDPAERWDDVLLRARRGRVRTGVVAAVVVALVAVPGAFAIGSKIVDLFDGSPAPPQVHLSFDSFNAMADVAVAHGFGQTFPRADASTAHGIVKVDTPDGPVDLWAAAKDGGGLCWFYDWEADATGPAPPHGLGGCDEATPPPSNLVYGTAWTAEHPQSMVLAGRVYAAAAAAVRVTLADGTTADLPVIEGLFIGAFDASAKVVSLTAYDAGGAVVAHEALP